MGLALVPTRPCAERFASGRLVKVFEFELATNESYVLLHRLGDEKSKDIHALTQWIVCQCRSEDSPIGDA